MRVDSLGQSWARLPEEHGLIFPDGYYLATGELKQFDSRERGLTLERVVVAPNGEDNAFSGIAIGKRGIVMSGDPGVFRSTDGLAWTLVQARPSRFAFHGSTMAFADGQFVMLSQDLAWRSLDGITWQSQQDTPGASGHWHALAFGNGHWVGLGDGKRKISENGFRFLPVRFGASDFERVHGRDERISVANIRAVKLRANSSLWAV